MHYFLLAELMTLEQQLKIKIFAQKTASLGEVETKQKLVELFEESLKMDNYYKQQIFQAWDIGLPKD
jgi:hypothetical protein